MKKHSTQDRALIAALAVVAVARRYPQIPDLAEAVAAYDEAVGS